MDEQREKPRNGSNNPNEIKYHEICTWWIDLFIYLFLHCDKSEMLTNTCCCIVDSKVFHFHPFFGECNWAQTRYWITKMDFYRIRNIKSPKYTYIYIEWESFLPRACVLGCEHGFLSAKSADCDAMDPNKVIRLKWRAIFHILRNQSYCYQTCYRKTMPKCLMSKVIFRSTWQKACRVHWNNSKFYSFNYSKTIFQRNECKHISNGITVLWHRNIHIFIGFNKRRWFAKFNKKNESNVCFDKVVTFFSLWHDVPPIRAKWWWCKTYGNNKVY